MFPTCFPASQILDIGSGPRPSLFSLFAWILRHPEPWTDLLYPLYKTKQMFLVKYNLVLYSELFSENILLYLANFVDQNQTSPMLHRVL